VIGCWGVSVCYFKHYAVWYAAFLLKVESGKPDLGISVFERIFFNNLHALKPILL
jgi:hypothetical protein